MKRWMPLLFGLLLVFSLGLAACGGDDDDGDDDGDEVEEAAQEVATEVVDAAEGAATEVSEAAGDVSEAAETAEAALMGDSANGEQLFSTNCASCHAVEGDEVVVGPSLAGVADRADERVEGMDAIAYLHQSMVEPDAFVVPDFSPGIMPSFAQLPEDDLNDLVAYMMTLSG